MKKLDKDLGFISKKLGNQDFLEKASKDIVEKEENKFRNPEGKKRGAGRCPGQASQYSVRINMISDFRLKELIRAALDEDIGSGDITTSSIFTGDETCIAQAISKEEIIVAGLDVFKDVFHVMDSSLGFEAYFCDGQSAGEGRYSCLCVGKPEGHSSRGKSGAESFSEDVRNCHDDAQVC